jgi:hypothetical protein
MNVSTTPGAFGCARTPITATIRRVALAGALAMGMSGLGVPAASAGQSQEIATGGGSVVFKHRGERVLAYDERRDGYGVAAIVLWQDDRTDRFHRKIVIDGRSGGGPARRNLKIPEGNKVSLTMCYTNNGQVDADKCSGTQDAEA